MRAQSTSRDGFDYYTVPLRRRIFSQGEPSVAPAAAEPFSSQQLGCGERLVRGSEAQGLDVLQGPE